MDRKPREYAAGTSMSGSVLEKGRKLPGQCAAELGKDRVFLFNP